MPRAANLGKTMKGQRGDCNVASPAIELRNVSLSFDSEVLLENINLSIARGEAFVLIGPSGQGKSTILKLMAGLIEPTSGEVLIEGKNRKTMRSSERDEINHKTGMLFQKNALFDSLSAFDNVAFPLREVVHAPEAEIEPTVSRYLEAVGLAHARDLFPDEISGGMQKRLGIARALAMKPQTVFYDDPTAGSLCGILALTRSRLVGARLAATAHMAIGAIPTRARSEAVSCMKCLKVSDVK